MAIGRFGDSGEFAVGDRIKATGGAGVVTD